MPDHLRHVAEARLAQLRQDLANGRAQLAHLRDILPKIEGAVQVLEELLESATPVVERLDDATEETSLCPNPNAAEPMNLP